MFWIARLRYPLLMYQTCSRLLRCPTISVLFSITSLSFGMSWLSSLVTLARTFYGVPSANESEW